MRNIRQWCSVEHTTLVLCRNHNTATGQPCSVEHTAVVTGQSARSLRYGSHPALISRAVQYTVSHRDASLITTGASRHSLPPDRRRADSAAGEGGGTHPAPTPRSRAAGPAPWIGRTRRRCPDTRSMRRRSGRRRPASAAGGAAAASVPAPAPARRSSTAGHTGYPAGQRLHVRSHRLSRQAEVTQVRSHRLSCRVPSTGHRSS